MNYSINYEFEQIYVYMCVYECAEKRKIITVTIVHTSRLCPYNCRRDFGTKIKKISGSSSLVRNVEREDLQVVTLCVIHTER